VITVQGTGLNDEHEKRKRKFYVFPLTEKKGGPLQGRNRGKFYRRRCGRLFGDVKDKSQQQHGEKKKGFINKGGKGE